MNSHLLLSSKRAEVHYQKPLTRFLVILLFTTIFSLSFSLRSSVYAQGVSISPTGNPPDPTAGLDVDFNNKGTLLTRLTTVQRDAIVSPAEGLLIFNTTTKCFNVFKNSGWWEICGNCVPPSAPVASANTPVCEGATLNLSASLIAGSTYVWTGPNGFSSTFQNPSISNITLAGTGTYSVTASKSGCNSVAGIVTVTVNSLPTTANAGPDQLNVSGTSTTLAANTPSSGTGSWSITSGTGGSVTNPSSPTSQFTGQTGQTYVLRWTITNGCGTSYDEVTISFSAGGPKKVFMTSTVYNANLGGVSGADSKCQARAVAAGLTGTFKAWISTSTYSPASNFTHNTYPYVQVGGSQVAANWTDLTDGSVATTSSAGYQTISRDEFGNNLSFNGNGGYGGCGSWAGGYFIMAWSATKSDGTFNPVNPSYPNCSTTCSDWTSSSGGGDIWIAWSNSNTADCGQALYHLMCFEQ